MLLRGRSRLVRHLDPQKSQHVFFSVFPALSSLKNVIPTIPVPELQDSSTIRTFQPQSSRPPSSRKQIFLEPRETFNRNFNSRIEDIKSSGLENPIESKSMTFIESEVDIDEASPERLIGIIDKFKPAVAEVNRMRFRSIQQELEKAFSQQQLASYLEQNYSKVEFANSRRSTRRVSKKKLAQRIINDIWGIKVNSKLTETSDLITKKTVPLSDLDIFLIRLNRRLLHWLSSNGCRIKLVKDKKELEISGTTSQVSNVEVNLIEFLRQSEKQELNLTDIKHLFQEKYGRFSLEKVAGYTDVFFKDVGNDIYEVHSQTPHQVERLKRLLLWSLNYNKHSNEVITLPEEPEKKQLFPFKDELSLSWNNRRQPLFTLKDCGSSRSETNHRLLSDLQRYDDANMNIDAEIPNKENDSEVDTIIKDEDAPILSQNKINDIYDQLYDFDYRKNLISLETTLSPVFTISLGNILFEGEQQETKSAMSKLFPTPPELSETTKFKFNSNVQLVADKALSLPIHSTSLTSGSDVLDDIFRDERYKNSVQITFLPSLFVEDNKDIKMEDLTKFQPVELWVDLKHNMTPDMDTLQLVTVEGENTNYVSLPSFKSDLKVSCQLSGNLLQEKGELAQDFELSIDDILNSQADRYTRFKSQPGLGGFLLRSKLDFQEETSISPYIDLNINGDIVRYRFISMEFRKKLSFDFNGREVQYNMVEGGNLGGRKVEVLFVGDMALDASGEERKRFGQLMNDAVLFVSEL